MGFQVPHRDRASLEMAKRKQLSGGTLKTIERTRVSDLHRKRNDLNPYMQETYLRRGECLCSVPLKGRQGKSQAQTGQGLAFVMESRAGVV